MLNKYRLNDICTVNTVWSYFLTSSGQQGLQRSLARTKFMTNWIQAPSSCSKVKLQSQRLQAAGSKFFGNTLASQNKTESMLQAWALGCKACRACQPEQNWIQAPSLGSGLQGLQSLLARTKLNPGSKLRLQAQTLGRKLQAQAPSSDSGPQAPSSEAPG